MKTRARVLAWIPTAISFALLLGQMAIPWTVPHFVTQDGPSHVYAGMVARELVLDHKNTIYAPLYTIQRRAVPNWSSTVLLSFIEGITGPNYAEATLASLIVLLGFLGLAYVNRAISPQYSPWTPVANFLFQTWFLWLGFYNFCLGMALMPFVVGYYLGRVGRFQWREARVLAALLFVLYLTHLVPTALALMAIGTVAFWVNVAVPTVGRKRPAWGEFGRVLAAWVPVIGVVMKYTGGTEGSLVYQFSAMQALKLFPMHVFLTGLGPYGLQAPATVFLAGYGVLAMLALRKAEWRSVQGGLVVTTALALVAYLVVPDEGFGGSMVRIRFSWAVFVFAGILACSASRLLFSRVPMALFLGYFLFANLGPAAKAAQAMSDATAEYLEATSGMAPGKYFVRLRYPSPRAMALYQFRVLGRDALLHVDALVAARTRSVALSDYEAVSRLFPVVFKEYEVGLGQQSTLWGFEGPGPGTVDGLKWISSDVRPLDYVVVVGEPEAPESIRQGMPAVLDYLNATMRLAATSRNGIVRVFERVPAVPEAGDQAILSRYGAE